MRTFGRCAVALAGTFCFTQASFISPTTNQVLAPGVPSTVEWNITGLLEPLNIYLVPGGATTSADKISDIATNVANNGSIIWRPEDSIPSSSHYAAIIVDARRIVVISSIFTINNVLSDSSITLQDGAASRAVTTRRTSTTNTKFVTVPKTELATEYFSISTQDPMPKNSPTSSTSAVASTRRTDGSKATGTIADSIAEKTYGVLALAQPYPSVTPVPLTLGEQRSTLTASSQSVPTQILHAGYAGALMTTYTVSSPSFTMTISVPVFRPSVTSKFIVASRSSTATASIAPSVDTSTTKTTAGNATATTGIKTAYTGGANVLEGGWEHVVVVGISCVLIGAF